MAVNDKIKQIQIGSTTYDIEPANVAQTEGVTVLTGVKAGSSATVASSTHTHTVAVEGTTGGTGATAVSAITGLTLATTQSTGDLGVLTDVTFSAGTTPPSKAIPQHTSTNSGNASGDAVSAITAISNFSGGGSTTKYFHPSFSGTAVTSGNDSGNGTVVASSGHTHEVTLTVNEEQDSGSTRVPYIAGFSAGTTPPKSAAPTHTSTTSGQNSGTKVVAVTGLPNFSGGSGSLEAYDAATGGTKKVSNGSRVPFVTSITGGGASGTGASTAAPNQHTHTVTVSGTTGANSGDAVSAVTGLPNFSGGSSTTKYFHPSFSGSAVTSGTDGGNGTVVASSGHTHSVTLTENAEQDSGSTRIQYVKSFSPGTTPASGATPNYASTSTGTNSGTTVVAVTDITSNTTSENGIAYIASATAPSLSANAAPNAHTHNVTVSGTTGNDSGSGTAVASSGHTHDITLTGNEEQDSGETRVPYVAGFAAGTTPPKSASPSHTSTNTGNNSGSAVAAVTGYPNFSGGGAGGKYMHFSAGTTPSSTASFSGTKSTAVVTSGTTKYLHHSHTAASLGTASTGTVGISGGSGSLEAYDAATSGTKKVADGTRVPFLTALTGTKTFNTDAIKDITLSASGTSTDGPIYVESISNTAASASGTAKAGSETHTHSYDKTTGVTLTANDATADGRIKYVESISNTVASDSGKYMHFSAGTTPPKSASFSGTATTALVTSGTTKYLHHTHTAASLGDPSTGTVGISGGSGDLVSNDTASGGIAYIADVTHTAASLTGTTTFNTDAIKDITLSASGTSTDGPIYVESISNTAASMVTSNIYNSTTKTLTINVSGGTTTQTRKYMKHTNTAAGTGTVGISGGSISKTTKYLHHSHTGASLTGTKTFVTGYPNFSGGSGDLTSSTTADGGIAYIASVTNGSYTPAGLVSLTAGTAPSLTFNTTASGGEYYVTDVSGGTTTATTKYLSAAPSHTSTASGAPSATTTFVTGVTGGTTTQTRKYMKHTNTAAGTGTVGATTWYLAHGHTGASLTGTKTFVTGYPSFSGGSGDLTSDTTSTNGIAYVASVAKDGYTPAGTVTLNHDGTAPSLTFNSTASGGEYYLNSHTNASLGTASTSNAAPHTHTHAYDKTTSVSLTPGTAPSVTTKYLSGASGIPSETSIVASHTHAHSYGSSTPLTTTTNSGSAVTLSGGAHTTKYLHTSTSDAAPAGHTHAYDKTASVSLTPGTAPSVTTKYLSATTGTPSGTATVAAHTHTHSVTAAGSVNLGSNDTASGGVKYVESHTNASLGELTRADVAPNSHTHSYGSSTALTTSKNSGTGVSTISGVSYTAPAPTTWYMAHGHTGASVGALSTSDAAPAGHTHTYDKTTGVSLTDGTASSVTTKYLSATTGTPSGTATVAAHPHTHSVTAAGSVSLGSNDTASGGVPYVATHTNASLGELTREDAAPKAHTHTYDKTTSVSLTAGTAPSISAKTTKYIHADTSDVAPNSHTHSVDIDATTGAPNTTETVVKTVAANGTANVVKNN